MGRPDQGQRCHHRINWSLKLATSSNRNFKFGTLIGGAGFFAIKDLPSTNANLLY